MTTEQTAQKAIPDKTLHEMVSLCKGDHTVFLERAKKYRQENADEILFARFFAEKGLLKKSWRPARRKRREQKDAP